MAEVSMGVDAATLVNELLGAYEVGLVDSDGFVVLVVVVRVVLVVVVVVVAYGSVLDKSAAM